MAVPFKEGHFIRCLFPFTSHPDDPAPVEHIGYCLGVVERKPDGLVVAVYTTTTQRLANQPKAKGVAEFSAEQSLALGQRKPFSLDLRKVAFLPCTPEFFPALGDPGCGIVGHRAPERLREVIRRLAKEAHEGKLVRTVGPLRPRS
ncbi:hypothetical protein [Azospirillum sp. SYSU D00513]|uniref:hypothetical protein n=1 Tax=Azospirillum sp. SYSU D00513 TaxID=2812561 RepID=UPI001A970F68|nr:hypothetical protein [Azospirillum sp. SYSU D00513]